jgi:hypothetical protein
MTDIIPHNWSVYDLIPQLLDRDQGREYTRCRCGSEIHIDSAYECPHCRTLYCDACAFAHRRAYGPQLSPLEALNYRPPYDADSL